MDCSRRNLVISVGVGSILFVVIFAWLYLCSYDNPNPESSTQTSKLEGGRREVDPNIQNSKISPSGQDFTSVQSQKLAEAVKLGKIPLLDSSTLTLNRNAAVLLEIPLEKIELINSHIKNYTAKLFAAEIANAHIEINGEIGEEIVVAAFDRTKLLEGLRLDISETISPAFGAFLFERFAHDRELGATNTEIRASIESNQNGSDRIVYKRTVLKNEAYSPDIPLQSESPLTRPTQRGPDGKIVPPPFIDDSPISTVVTKLLVRDNTPIRLRHLFDAIDKLPRKNK